MGSGVDLLARKIRLAMAMVVESRIAHYSLDPMVLAKYFGYFGSSVSRSRSLFHS